MVGIAEISKYWMTTEIILFNILGNFGNFNLLWLTFRRKELRTKPGSPIHQTTVRLHAYFVNSAPWFRLSSRDKRSIPKCVSPLSLH